MITLPQFLLACAAGGLTGVAIASAAVFVNWCYNQLSARLSRRDALELGLCVIIGLIGAGVIYLGLCFQQDGGWR